MSDWQPTFSLPYGKSHWIQNKSIPFPFSHKSLMTKLKKVFSCPVVGEWGSLSGCAWLTEEDSEQSIRSATRLAPHSPASSQVRHVPILSGPVIRSESLCPFNSRDQVQREVWEIWGGTFPVCFGFKINNFLGHWVLSSLSCTLPFICSPFCWSSGFERPAPSIPLAVVALTTESSSPSVLRQILESDEAWVRFSGTYQKLTSNLGWDIILHTHIHAKTHTHPITDIPLMLWHWYPSPRGSV